MYRLARLHGLGRRLQLIQEGRGQLQALQLPDRVRLISILNFHNGPKSIATTERNFYATFYIINHAPWNVVF
jgi:hypothetical protein